MKRLSVMVACALIIVVQAAAPASASIISYSVLLSGAQSVPPSVASTASGSAVVTVDDALDTVSVMLSFTGLNGGPATAAHIHCCVAPSGTASVVIPFNNFPFATSGTYTSPFPMPVSAFITAGIEAGLAYINIHNAAYPGGEIRGNILPAAVPEPASIGLLGAGLLAALGTRVRARRSSSRPTEGSKS